MHNRKMETERKIIKTLLKENSDFTIRALSKKIHSDYRITHAAMTKLIQKGIVKKKEVGKSSLCSLNKWNTSSEMIYAENERAQEIFRHSDLRQLHKEIMSKSSTPFFILLLFGSFAKEKNNKHSDIDLMFVTNEANFEEKMQRILRMLPLDIHLLVFTQEQFTQMAFAREATVVTEALNNYVILHGAENLYCLMRK